MTVRELITELSRLNKDLEVIMSKDGEGNNFSLLDDVVVGRYNVDSSWSGEFYDLEKDDPDKPNAICLWPRN